MAKACITCGKTGGFIKDSVYVKYQNNDLCPDCAEKLMNDIDNKIIITGTDNINGYEITEYICLESAELIIATPFIFSFSGNMTDYFDKEPILAEKNIKKAKDCVIKKLKRIAYECGGNAIVRADIDYVNLDANRTAIIVNGTIVKLNKI